MGALCESRYIPNFVKHQFHRFDLLQPLAFNYLENQIARSTGLIRFVSTHMATAYHSKHSSSLYILGRSSLPCIWLWVPTGQHVGGSSSPVLPFPLEPWILIPAMLVAGLSSSQMCPSVSLDLLLAYFSLQRKCMTFC